MIAATGVVFGDIATSPLYAFRESFIGAHALPLDRFHVLGVLSLLVWTLLIVVTLKYVAITMRADNRGEGGSFALLALIDARMAGWVLPVTLAIVVLLFAVQHRGTHALAAWFGPLMLVWLLVIASLGIFNIAAAPEVLKALDPQYALRFLAFDPARSFLTLGTVVLAVTGAEALYADMGHFGRKPIARAWLWLALPALLLCYAGQSALVLSNPAAIENPFYRMGPASLLAPLVVLSSIATVIASQSIISGAFSVTQQAVRLGYLPRMTILQTSSGAVGQVYAPLVNAVLLAAVIALIVGFGSSSALAAAFGFAVTTTMLLSTLLIGYVIFRIWRWNLFIAVPVYAIVLTFDAALFAASSTKFLAGGWLPVLVAVVLSLLFYVWRRGRAQLADQRRRDGMPLETFLASIAGCPRVAGTAVYLTSVSHAVPAALLHNLKHNKIVHESILLVTVETLLVPVADTGRRVSVAAVTPGIDQVTVRYGFMELPDVPAALTAAGVVLPDCDVTYMLSRETIVPRARAWWARWRGEMFAALVRNAETPMRSFRLPANRVMELGSQVELD